MYMHIPRKTRGVFVGAEVWVFWKPGRLWWHLKCAAEVNWEPVYTWADVIHRWSTSSQEKPQPSNGYPWRQILATTQHTCKYLLIRIVNQGVRIQLQDGPDSFEHVRAIKLLDPSLFLLQMYFTFLPQEIQSFWISPQHFQTLRCSCNISEINFPSKNHPPALVIRWISNETHCGRISIIVFILHTKSGQNKWHAKFNRRATQIRTARFRNT